MTGGSYWQIGSGWQEPTVDCSASPNAYASFWIGIGGDPQLPLYQLGTMATCANGIAYHSLWYEEYPNPMVVLSYTVAAGDRISVGIDMQQGKMGVVTSQGLQFEVHIPYDPKNSVEWIAEAPTNSQTGTEVSLANFGSITFQLCSANNGAVRIGQGTNYWMYAPDGGITYSSAPVATGSTDYFTTWWAHR